MDFLKCANNSRCGPLNQWHHFWSVWNLLLTWPKSVNLLRHPYPANSDVPAAGLEDLSSQAIVDVLTREILAAANETTADNSVLGDLIIDLDSLEVQGKDIYMDHLSET